MTEKKARPYRKRAEVKQPKYRRQRQCGGTDRAFVEIHGRRRYLGVYGSPDSLQRYHRLLAEHAVQNDAPPDIGGSIHVVRLICWYRQYAKGYYRLPDGTPSSMMHRIRAALTTLRKLYGRLPAEAFGPNQLRAVRQVWVDAGFSLATIRDYVGIIRRMFTWATARDMVPAAVSVALDKVEGLRKGRSAARDVRPVVPVPKADIDSTLPHLSRTVATLVQLQLYTGARPGEWLRARAGDIDASGAIWVYSPQQHKTSYRGGSRKIYLGPRSQEIIAPFLAVHALDAYLFSPREAEAERHATASCHRRPDQAPNPKKTERVVGDHYTPTSYRKAIATACQKAGVPVWTPNRIRHTAATNIRREYGLEAAQVILGHATANVTQVYAQRDEEKAKAVVMKIG